MYSKRFLSALGLYAASCSAGAAHSIPVNDLELRAENTSEPVAPRQDPWYTAPIGYEKVSPGAVLRVRTAPGNLCSVIGNCSAAYNVMFRTTNSYYQPTFAVTTVLIPSSNHTGIGSSLLSYQIPYNTADIDGSPSYFLHEGGYPDIPVALGEGWVVNVPDFEGPLASFLLGLTEGRAVLDSIRSVLSQTAFGLPQNTTKTALWGYSGGSVASMFAVELHATYAPELKLHGAAIGGTVPSFSATLSLANASPQAGLLPAAFLGLTSQSSTARELLMSSLLPDNASEFLNAANFALTGQLQSVFSGKDIPTYFANYSSFLFAPEIQAIQRDNWHLGYHGVPQIPIYMYKAIEDEVAPVEEVDELVHRLCSLGGVDILYERNRIGGHVAEYYNGVSRARQFLSSILDGDSDIVPVRGGCVVKDVTTGADVRTN